VFDQLRLRNVVTWSALLNGHAQSGDIGMTLILFRGIIAMRIVPNAVTITTLLTTCSHAGAVEEGGSLFDELCIVYGLDPMPELCTCIVDLFGQSPLHRADD
jgi:pentatricopeptide repeat protein